MPKIPEGFNTINAYASFDQTAEAVDFYKKALGAEEIMRLPGKDGGLAYAELRIGNSTLSMGDACKEWGVSAKTLGGSPVSFYVFVDDVESAFKKAKAAGMSVVKEIEDVFWGDRMGALKDPFGMQWTLAQHIREVSKEDMQAAIASMN